MELKCPACNSPFAKGEVSYFGDNFVFTESAE